MPIFSDIANHWARGCISVLEGRGIISGYPNGTFRPNGVLTRAEFAALMTRVFSALPEQQVAADFKDVTSQYWANTAIKWVSQRGLFSGYGDATFRPAQSISRVEAVIVLVAGLKAGKDDLVQPSSQSVTQIAQQFSDADTLPTWARSAIAYALESQLLEQLSELRPLLPTQSITRGEVSALICRAINVPAADLIVEYPSLSTAQNRSAIFQQFLKQEVGFTSEKLAFLDKSVGKSPFFRDTSQSALRLKAFSQPSEVISRPIEGVADYPNRGVLPSIDNQGLDFLSSDMVAGCLCLSTLEAGKLRARWLGRLAMNNRQLWSATKFVALLNVIDKANSLAPDVSIGQCQIRAAGRQLGYPFYDLAVGIVSYDNRIATSNSLAVMFKNFETPALLENWLRQLTGNVSLSFRGRYGEVPFIQYPELWDTGARKVLLKAANEEHRGDNLLSPYDLTRLLSMAAWHYQLSGQADINNVKGHSLEPVINAMGIDTARYVDIALEILGLTTHVRNPVIISKSGFGRSDLRNRTELTYCAHVQFALPRQGAADPTAPYEQYAFGFTLMAASATGDANQEARYVDALMAADVTELVRRVVTDAL